LDSLLEELSEEINILNEANDAFANAEVTKRAKQIQTDLKQGAQFEEDAIEHKILQVAELITEEKTLKATLKTAVDALHIQTKTKIEQLTDVEILTLLEAKWLDPIMDALAALPTRLVQDFAAQVQALADKYATTLVDTQAQIRESEQSLAALMDELTGSEYDMQGINELKKLLGGV
jgi:type I restriction enzyme M protein